MTSVSKVSRLFAGCAAVLALHGCVHPDFAGMKPYWKLHDEHFRQLKPGMTQEDVQKIVGKPPWRLAFPARSEEIWSYQYLDHLTHTRMRSSVHFDAQGVLKYATREYDMDYYDCMLC